MAMRMLPAGVLVMALLNCPVAQTVTTASAASGSEISGLAMPEGRGTLNPYAAEERWLIARRKEIGGRILAWLDYTDASIRVRWIELRVSGTTLFKRESGRTSTWPVPRKQLHDLESAYQREVFSKIEPYWEHGCWITLYGELLLLEDGWGRRIGYSEGGREPDGQAIWDILDLWSQLEPETRGAESWPAFEGLAGFRVLHAFDEGFEAISCRLRGFDVELEYSSWQHELKVWVTLFSPSGMIIADHERAEPNAGAKPPNGYREDWDSPWNPWGPGPGFHPFADGLYLCDGTTKGSRVAEGVTDRPVHVPSAKVVIFSRSSQYGGPQTLWRLDLDGLGLNQFPIPESKTLQALGFSARKNAFLIVRAEGYWLDWVHGAGKAPEVFWMTAEGKVMETVDPEMVELLENAGLTGAPDFPREKLAWRVRADDDGMRSEVGWLTVDPQIFEPKLVLPGYALQATNHVIDERAGKLYFVAAGNLVVVSTPRRPTSRPARSDAPRSN